jgi:hypothetical protein
MATTRACTRSNIFGGLPPKHGTSLTALVEFYFPDEANDESGAVIPLFSALRSRRRAFTKRNRIRAPAEKRARSRQ